MTNKELREKVAKWLVNQRGYSWGGDLCDQERIEYMEKAANFLSIVAEALPEISNLDIYASQIQREYRSEVKKLLKGE